MIGTGGAKNLNGLRQKLNGLRRRGRKCAGERLHIEAIFWILRAGAPWRAPRPFVCLPLPMGGGRALARPQGVLMRREISTIMTTPMIRKTSTPATKAKLTLVVGFSG